MKQFFAFVLAAICFTCTLIILFGHVRSTADLTVIHLYIFVSFVVSVGAGYYMEHARFFLSLSFLVIFMISTGVCVTLSGSRSHASLEKKIREAQDANDHRAKIASQLNDFEKLLASRQRLLEEYMQTVNKSIETAADQCSTGKGRKCEGTSEGVALRTSREEQLRKEIDDAQKNVASHTQLLRDTPPKEANAELQPLADLYSMVTGTPRDRAMHIVITILSYSLAILTEFSGITFMNYALARHTLPPTPAQVQPLPATPVPSPQRTSKDIPLAQIARELSLDPRVARKRVRELGIQKPLQGWSFPSNVAEEIKSRLSQLH